MNLKTRWTNTKYSRATMIVSSSTQVTVETNISE